MFSSYIDFIDAYYMIINMTKQNENKNDSNCCLTTGLCRLASRSFTLVCALVLASALAVVIGSGNVYAEYTKEQYCKEQGVLGKKPIICASPDEQQKAKINDPTYDAKVSDAEKEFQRAKSVHESKVKQGGNNQNQGNKNQDGGKNQNQKDQNNKSQEPEHKDDGDGSNKKKDGNKSGGGNGSTGGGGASSSPHQCGSAGTFFDWGCSGADDSKIIVTTLITISNWIALGAVVIVTFGIIYGAIIYATSAGDATKAKKGISIIRNAIIALMLYLLMWAILQYVVPGGLFG